MSDLDTQLLTKILHTPGNNAHLDPPTYDPRQLTIDGKFTITPQEAERILQIWDLNDTQKHNVFLT